MFVTLNILLLIAFEMGYQFIIGNVTNPSQVRKFKLLQPSTILNIHYGVGYIFNDGTKSDHYFNLLRKNYNYNDHSLQKLNTNLIMYMFAIDLNQMRLTMNKHQISINQANHVMITNFIKATLRKKQNMKMHENIRSNL